MQIAVRQTPGASVPPAPRYTRTRNMKRLVLLLMSLTLPLAAADPYKIAVIGLVHSHVWSQMPRMIKNDPVKLVGISEPNADLTAEAKKLGAADNLFFDDYKRMLDETKPDFVWAFVENNRHLEIVRACAPRKIHVIFEKPLAATAEDAITIRDLARK